MRVGIIVALFSLSLALQDFSGSIFFLLLCKINMTPLDNFIYWYKMMYHQYANVDLHCRQTSDAFKDLLLCLETMVDGEVTVSDGEVQVTLGFRVSGNSHFGPG